MQRLINDEWESWRLLLDEAKREGEFEMFYRWSPYFEADCRNPEYLKQIQEEQAWQIEYRRQQEQRELQRFWEALQAVPSYVEQQARAWAAALNLEVQE